jgi:hypothetical protein
MSLAPGAGAAGTGGMSSQLQRMAVQRLANQLLAPKPIQPLAQQQWGQNRQGGLLSGMGDQSPAYLNMLQRGKKKEKEEKKTWQDYVRETQENQTPYGRLEWLA